MIPLNSNVPTVAAPGEGSITPTPPTGTRPQPRTEPLIITPVTVKPVMAAPAIDIGQTTEVSESTAKFARPLVGNIIRVYNPVKQSVEKDKEGSFIRRWLPQLSELPKEIIHTPWELSPMEQQLYQCRLGETYPLPMIDINETGKIARDILWGFRQRFDTKKEGQRIISKHVRTSKKVKKVKKTTTGKIKKSKVKE